MITVQQGSAQHKMHKAIVWGLFAAVLVAIPFILPEFQVGRMNRAMYMAIAILGVNLVLGYGGLFALGHSVFIGIGAFTTVWLVQDKLWDYWMTVPIAMFFCFVVGLIIGIPALRIKGLYLALITVGMATVFPSLGKIENFGIVKITGGANGRDITEDLVPTEAITSWLPFTETEPARYRYFVVLFFTALAFWMVSNLVKSRPGRALVAIRDNETGAAVSGVDLTRFKVLNFGVSAALGGLAGAMWATDKGFVAEQDYNFLLAIELLVGLVIGGVATVPGAMVGALVVVFVKEFTKNASIPLGFYTVSGDGPLSQAIFGFILIVVTFFAPGGLVWLFRLLKSKVYRVSPVAPELKEEVIPLGQSDLMPSMT